MYARVNFWPVGDNHWKEAKRFYQAARYRDWWVSLASTSVYLTDVPTDEIARLLCKLGQEKAVIDA